MSTKEQDFLVSALTERNPFLDSRDLPDWLEARRRAHSFQIERIPFDRLRQWSFDPETGNLGHDSGKFFSIVGISVTSDFGPVRQWSQPVINQPEVGILGILAKKFDGVLYFLMQAKMEPGNINTVQLAPTLQATRSNYTRVHKGASPPYLEFFLDRAGSRVLVDSLQSEQGARFLRKRNRNIIIETTRDVEVSDDHCWLTLGQIHKQIAADNIVNMDARTVLSCISFAAAEPGDLEAPDILPRISQLAPLEPRLLETGFEGFKAKLIASALDTTRGLHSDDDVISWFTELKVRHALTVEPIPLNRVEQWRKSEMDISHVDGRFFSVIAVSVQADSREVLQWTQPLVEPREEGIVAYIVKDIGGVLHFLVQAKVEPGNFDVVEMAPTVQCITGSYRQAKPSGRPPFLDYVLQVAPEAVRASSLQSEEGGRFFREQNRNMVIEAGEDFPLEAPDNYIWMTLNQLKTFIKYNNFVNVEGRCLLACLGFL